MLGSLQYPSQLSKKQQKQEREWFAVSFKPENFIPGLVIGFIFGLFLDLSKPIKNNNNTTPKKAANLLLGKQQRLVSTNTDEELKMVLSLIVPPQFFVHSAFYLSSNIIVVELN
ncbi:uncharacterized protein LOC114273903 isoform X1 [Camellia sinensis]|uniref:uncharacterized protein LOC114273903 isoform X1 n=1 Tax=Camellia sinensis TaxID=4442 RepID=UPI001035A3A0|nr:uncharacterized protein LOC114273903 isoform X1 [Camellia sinensis]